MGALSSPPESYDRSRALAGPLNIYKFYISIVLFVLFIINKIP